MDDTGRGRKGGEITMTEKRTTDNGEVLVAISGDEIANANITPKGLLLLIGRAGLIHP